MTSMVCSASWCVGEVLQRTRQGGKGLRSEWGGGSYFAPCLPVRRKWETKQRKRNKKKNHNHHKYQNN